MSSSVALPDTHGSDHEYYIYDVLADSVLPSSGKPGTNVDFVGYLSVGSLPTLYALYLREQLGLSGYIRTPMLHASPYLTPRNDVPCYILILDFFAPPLNLPFLMGMSCEDSMYGLYHYATETGTNIGTVVYLARYPTGYYKVTDSDLVAFLDIFTALVQGTSVYPQSWICSEPANVIPAVPGITVELHKNEPTPTKLRQTCAVDRSIHKIMMNRLPHGSHNFSTTSGVCWATLLTTLVQALALGTTINTRASTFGEFSDFTFVVVPTMGGNSILHIILLSGLTAKTCR
ncbi:hypothetical protein F4604DRAFT_1923528 [Suillus subluteus]|nr:hypothetical protein F4604DRAFT_1923528 [Suillus subluteus]